MSHTLSGQTVIITGASSGIGEAVARRCGAEGANVVLFARRRDRLEKLGAEIDPAGQRTLCVAGDVTRAEDRVRLVAETLAKFGRIDGLVNNAGFGQRGPIEQIPLDAIRRNFETNVFALLGLTQEVAPRMRQQGRGRIVLIGSVAGKLARPMTSTYDATKHALEAFADGLRGELKPFGIHVALVRPGFIITEFIEAADSASANVMENLGPYAPYAAEHRGASQKLRRVAGRPEDVAELVRHALSSPSPKSHYAGPFHAKVLLFLRWLLPTSWIDYGTRLRRPRA
jgi:short-subunit dehydrogenase